MGQEINLGTGVTISIGELADKIFALLGKTPKIVSDAHRMRPDKSEVFRLHASNRKARELLGWTPQVSLEEGLRRTIEWISDHLDLYRPDQYMV
jgi:dTDP-glucose 4,6-dehydratase